MHLPDVNFWLALVFDSHFHHPPAKKWMEQAAPRSVSFCRVTQMGFLRLATNPKAFPLHAVPMNESWRLYEVLSQDQRVALTDEPSGLESAFRGFTQFRTFSTNVWTDAYLAAFATTADYELVTFHKGFVQFPGLRFSILS